MHNLTKDYQVSILSSKRGRTIKAVLFDIDGTILNCSGAGKKSLIEACLEVFGTAGNMHDINFQGKTDPVILHESLRHMGYSREDIRDRAGSLKNSYFRYLEKNISKENTIIFPGIIDLLEMLQQMKHIVPGLLTGNYKQSAAIKLATYGLNSYFSFGAYGDDAPDRNGLPAVAQQRIAETFDISIDFSNMVVIGDTIYDIECARSVGAVSVIVGTGWSDKKDLLSHDPHYYFDDLSDTPGVLNAIMM